ncbi:MULTISPECIES: hypothetical protein [unclassified Streptomyces]|uniref:hypothetical protein n=1 Tax=unclassified Streptomyces TaxID=2593676 RepID=UPI00342EFE83
MVGELSPESTELVAGLAFPVDRLNVSAQFFCCLVEGGLGFHQSVARVFQSVRVRRLDQVDHRVELGTLEARLAEEPARAAAPEPDPETVHHRRDALESVGRGELALDQSRVLRLLLLRGQFWLLLATHQFITPGPS